MRKSFAPFLAAALLAACAASPAADEAYRPEPVTQVVWLEHVPAAELAGTLKRFLVAPDGRAIVQVEPVASQNALLLRGPGDGVRESIDLIAQLDTGRDAPADSLVIALQHKRATEVADVLRQLLGDQSAGGRDGGCIVAPHPESNSLLIRGDGRKVDQVRTLVAQLDVPEDGR